MPVHLELRFEGADHILSKLAPNILLNKPLEQALHKSALLVEGEAKRLVPVDTGNLRRSIRTLELSPRHALVGTRVKYAVAVHEGRRAGAAMPPPDRLKGWARRHGKIPPYVLARAIGRRGIKARPFMRDALDRLRGVISLLLSKAVADIEAEWGRR